MLPPKKPVDQKQPEIAPPPEVGAKTPPTETSPTLQAPPQLPGWESAKKKPKKARRKLPPAVAAASQGVTGPQPQGQAPAQPGTGQAASEPQLTPMMSDSQRASFNTAVNELVSKTERNLGAAETRSLSEKQRGIIGQARTFLAQAQEIRGKDLAAARSLAERAEILSREVLSEIK